MWAAMWAAVASGSLPANPRIARRLTAEFARPPEDVGHIRYVHIPKTGGASLAKKWKIFAPEECFDHVTAGGNFTMVSLRSPRAHVHSLFLECRHSQWGQAQTNGTAFPRTDNGTADYVSWLRHFQRAADAGPAFDYRCYDPRDMQTRQLSCTWRPPRRRKDPPGPVPTSWLNYRDPRHAHHASAPTAPDPELTALQAVATRADFVLVTDLYLESMCVFDFRRTGALPKGCTCAEQRAGRGPKLINLRHGVPPHSEEALGAEVLEAVDGLTVTDRNVFKVGLARFMGELNATEENVGQRVLCPETWSQIRAELAYLWGGRGRPSANGHAGGG
jgi:hypothetical protein